MSTKLALFLIFILNFIVVLVWFQKGLMFGGGEEGIPLYNITNHLRSASYVWNESQGGFDMVLLLPRIPFFTILVLVSEIGLNIVKLQALMFFLLIFLGCSSVYFLIKETTLQGNVPFFGSVFYFFNPFSMIQIWGRGIYAQFFAFALIPLFLLFYILGLKRKNVIYFILAIFASVVLAPAFVFPTQVLVLWIPIFTYFIFYVWANKKNKNEIFFVLWSSLLFGILWLLAQSWWLWPYIRSLGENVLRLGDIEYNLGSLRGISSESSFGIVIRLIHKFISSGLYGDSYLSLPFKMMSWSIPFMLMFSINRFKKIKYFWFYTILFLISLFFVMGTSSLLGPIFEWLFRNIPLFQGFRNPYEKVGVLLMLAFTPFFAIGLNGFSRLVKCLVIVLVCGIYVWPMWTGQFAGGIKISPWFKVPSYYKEADNWIKNQDKNSRIIQLPLNPGDGVIYTWDHPFRGLESGEFLFSNPSIGRNLGINKNYYNILLERFNSLQKNVFGPDPDLSKSEFRSQYLYQELEKLNIKYIVLHRDIDEMLSGMKLAQDTSEFLANQKNIKKVKTFGLLDIYKVELSNEVAHVYSPSTETSYQKINPTLYKFYVNGAIGPIDIRFLERFDPGWELIVNNEKIDTHATAFSYANFWFVNKTGSYIGYIKYKPQDFVYQGKKTSIITIYSLIGVTIIIILTRFYDKYR